MIEFNTTKHEPTGLWEGTATLTLPPITVSRIRADRSDFKYEIQRALTDVLEQIVEKHLEE